MEEQLRKSFIVNFCVIVVFGVVMVYSSSYIYAKEVLGSSLHFVLRQLSFIGIGSLLAFVVARSKFTFWYKHIHYILAAITFCILLTYTPMGHEVKGANRWLRLGAFGFQPGEFAKYAMIIFSVKYFNSFKSLTWPKEGLLWSALLLVPPVLLLFQPDFGSFSVLVLMVLFAAFIGPVKKRYFFSMMGVSLAGVFSIALAAPYRVKRLLTFLDPWSAPQGSGFQIIQSYLAFANGHIFGQGIGNSNEKLFYLPEAYNDFIFSVVGEELGLFGVVLTVILYFSLVYLGFKLALSVRSKVNQQIIACIMFYIGLQAFLNMGVVLGLLPTKGLNLPFISYGGSSMIANILAIGCLFSCLREKSQIEDVEEVKETNGPFNESQFSWNDQW